MKPKAALVVTLLIAGFAVLFISQKELLRNYTPAMLLTGSESTSLYKEIESKSKEMNEAPENAYIDQVWKKTPGLDGRKVDIKKSYEKMKKNGIFDKKLLVYDTVPPGVSIDDLPPAPIYRGNPEKEMVTLLINVSWGEEYIPEMLKTLNEKNVKANFFIDGRFAEKNPDIVKMIHEQEHIIGNHAYNHPDMSRMDKASANESISQTNDVLRSLINDETKWFAPPAGGYNQQVVEAAEELEMYTILWTVDTIDWKKPTKEVLLQRVLPKAHNGATILMHPTAVTADSLDELIDGLRDKGFRIGNIETLMDTSR
ncbi:polysaccharide deacetylase family protein [Thalassobacillus hwangdonensis]|uniref:Polysaccharide deacetylase family protein n=1 Tax=Thalassobacillus hwangdonensis TaxID=546108 RepID=A0ABW3L0V8_9BACI